MKLNEVLVEFVEKRGNQWVVVNHTRKKVLGKHATKGEAEAQLRAIEANKHLHEQQQVTPKITWRTNGDNSFTVRVEYTPEKVYVHTNKNRGALEKLVKDRYQPRTM